MFRNKMILDAKIAGITPAILLILRGKWNFVLQKNTTLLTFHIVNDDTTLTTFHENYEVDNSKRQYSNQQQKKHMQFTLTRFARLFDRLQAIQQYLQNQNGNTVRFSLGDLFTILLRTWYQLLNSHGSNKRKRGLVINNRLWYIVLTKPVAIPIAECCKYKRAVACILAYLTTACFHLPLFLEFR